MKHFILIVSVIFHSCSLAGQTCASPGQNPSTAFPVCGTNVFTQSTVPICGDRVLRSPQCTDRLTDKNPFWYKFTCFQTGSLGFLITPKDLNSDYDWQLYDITGKNPNDVYTDGSFIVSSNWSGEKGLTGASSAGTQTHVCGGLGRALFSRMPVLQAGRDYLLLISHFSDNQSGYDLSFQGGSAVITDPNAPRLNRAEPDCGGNTVRLKLNKKIKCSSIATDGSDFLVTSGSSSSTSSTGIECTSKFDTDSIEIKLNQPLPPGNYTLRIKKGTDGNTLLDYCDKEIPVADEVTFSVLPSDPTPMDNLAPVSCAPKTLKLVFSKPIDCTSIAANGSDFIIAGPYPVAILSASAACNVPSSQGKEIVITLSQPLQRGGNFRVTLQKGNDGNTIRNECGIETPPGSFISFNVMDTVNAGFNYNIQYGCTEDIVQFSHPGQNTVNSWEWKLDDNKTSTQQNPRASYAVFKPKNIELIVSNGFCTDSSRQTIVLDNFLNADFTVNPDNCPAEPVLFTSTANGKMLQHHWLFGDGGSSTDSLAMHTYTRPNGTTAYNVRYTVTDGFGCQKSIEKPVKIYVSCFIDVPNAFTPNADGKNDVLYPLNAIKAEQLEFKVFNRWGHLIFKTNNWKQGWDGRYNGILQPPGVYVWILQYISRDTKHRVEKKGTAVLIR